MRNAVPAPMAMIICIGASSLIPKENIMVSSKPDEVIAVDLGFVPEAAVSGPIFFQAERSAYLTFNATHKTRNGRFEDAGTAVVEIPNCLITRLGYPNDDGRSGYPFYKGLDYGVYEILNSLWVRQLMEFKRTRFPKPAADWWGLEGRHFLVTFHDSTFECISSNLNATSTKEPLESVIQNLLKRIQKE
jgi:hypothetical protein